jgi:uncharacterized membrane protein YfcA
MMEWLQEHTLLRGDGMALWLAVFGAVCIGLSKSGLAGTATLTVVLMAKAFGAKASVGLVLPLLIAADVMGWWLNRSGGSWRKVWTMAPPAMIGVVIGWQLLGRIENAAARVTIGWLIIVLLGFKLLVDARREALVALTTHHAFTWAMGLAAGIVTMLANAAGPVMTVYLLAQHLEKKEHIGVFTRFFLFINLFKVPFSTNLGIIHPASLLTNLLLMPAVVAGILIGWQILKRIPQKAFERTLFILTLLAALWLIAG